MCWRQSISYVTGGSVKLGSLAGKTSLLVRTIRDRVLLDHVAASVRGNEWSVLVMLSTRAQRHLHGQADDVTKVHLV